MNGEYLIEFDDINQIMFHNQFQQSRVLMSIINNFKNYNRVKLLKLEMI